MARGRQEGAPNFDVLRTLTQLDDALSELRTALSSQERGFNALSRDFTEVQRNASDLRGLLASIEGTVNGETRALRDELSVQSNRLDSLDYKLAQIEGLQNNLATTIDNRLKSLNQQVTTAVGAMLAIVVAGMILLLLIR